MAGVAGAVAGGSDGVFALVTAAAPTAIVTARATMCCSAGSYQKLRVRLIVELYMQEDQHESHAAALKVLAIGRVQSR